MASSRFTQAGRHHAKAAVETYERCYGQTAAAEYVAGMFAALTRWYVAKCGAKETYAALSNVADDILLPEIQEGCPSLKMFVERGKK